MHVYNGQMRGGSASLRVIRSQDEWHTLARQLDHSLPNRLPHGQMAILVSMGTVGCHEAIDIRNVTVEDGALVVHVQRHDAGGHYARNTITQPWSLAMVPASDKPIVERDFVAPQPKAVATAPAMKR